MCETKCIAESRIVPFAVTLILAVMLAGLSGCRQTKQSQEKIDPNDKKAEGDKNSAVTKPNRNDFAPVGNSPPDFAFRQHTNSGIDFIHSSGFDDQRAFPAANGSGIGVIDFDLDGWDDLCFANAKRFPVSSPSVNSLNQCYRNLGNWQFANCSQESGLDVDGFCTGMAVGDFDNDGFQDIYVGCYGTNFLFHNLGDGSFDLVAQADGAPAKSTVPDSGLPPTPGWAASCVFVDYNQDGLLDIYVGNYGIWNMELKKDCGDRANQEPRFCSPTSVRPQADVLYENLGDGRFKDVSQSAGIYPSIKNGEGKTVIKSYRTQGVLVTDFNNDGFPDIYCGNDMNSNLLLINNKGKGFINQTELSSTGYGESGEEMASMGVAAGDANNDGQLDLFCTNFSNEVNSFYQGLGDLQFAEVSKRNRLVDGALAWVGWGTDFVDLDGDGWLDVIVTNGHVDPNIQYFEKSQQHLQPCLIWKNEQGRFRLAKVEGEYFEERHPGRALVLADFDRDGDQDVVIGHQDRAPALLENVTGESMENAKKISSLRLVGTRSNRDGLGCRIEFDWNGKTLARVIGGGGSYLSSHSGTKSESRWSKDKPIRIYWPSGTTQEIKLESNQESGNPVVVVEN